jgi:hypothetical protein
MLKGQAFSQLSLRKVLTKAQEYDHVICGSEFIRESGIPNHREALGVPTSSRMNSLPRVFLKAIESMPEL